MPEKLDACPARPALGEIHYLNLHCSDDVRRARLTARPPWRNSSKPEFIEEHRRFARWLLDESGMPVIDTSDASPEETADAVAEWVRSLC
jgi:regulator of PEP synthase PpsR (kinase-PPPase family)